MAGRNLCKNRRNRPNHPPMGMNVFVVAGVTRMPVTEVFKGIWPFVVTELIILALLVMLPQLALWLPAFIYG